MALTEHERLEYQKIQSALKKKLDAVSFRALPNSIFDPKAFPIDYIRLSTSESSLQRRRVED
jgi:hypothetical protein